jgi:hypothetical protein
MSQTVGVSLPPPLPATQPPRAGRSWGRAAAASLAVFVVAGLVAGWAWQHWAPLARYVVDESGGSMNEEEMTRVFGPDGLFVSIGFVAALVLAAALFWWLRDNGPLAVVLLVACSAAGSGVAWAFGMLLGRGDALDVRLAAAKPGDLVAAPLELHGWSALASWPLGAALAVAIIAALGWRQEQVDHDHADGVAGHDDRGPGPFDGQYAAGPQQAGPQQVGPQQVGSIQAGPVQAGPVEHGGPLAGGPSSDR